MNILIITWDFWPQKGGIATYSDKVAEQLTKDGYKVVVLTRDNLASENVKKIYKIIRYKQYKHLSFIPPFIKTIEIVLKYKINFIFLFHAMSTTALGVLFLKYIKYIKLGIFVQGYDLVYSRRTKIDRYVTDILFKKADVLLPNSNFVKERFLGLVNNNNNIIVVHPGVSLPPNNIKIIKTSFDIYCLTVCNLVSGKGLDNLIRAFRIIVDKHSKAYLNIIGQGPLYNNLNELIKETKLGNNVKLIGNIDNESLVNYYKICDLFVLTPAIDKDNRCEGFGIVYLEAASYGKPVIATKSGGIQEAVLDGVTGILVEPNSPTQIAQAIIHLIENDKYRNELGRNGFARVEKEFAWEKAILPIENVLNNE